MSQEQQYALDWLKKHDLISQRALENKAGLPQGSLHKACKGLRNLPEHYIPFLYKELKSYGFNPWEK